MWHFRSLQLIFCIFCIYLVYVLLSILSNKLFKTPYQNRHREQSDYFVYADLLQVFSCGACYLAGYFYSRVVKKEGPSSLPRSEWTLLGCLFTLRVSCPNYALYFLPYATRVLWDKLGYFSTILFSVLFSRYSQKSQLKLPLSKLKPAVLISLGALLFTSAYTSSSPASSSESSSSQIGYLLIIIALLSKGLFIDNQSYCKNQYNVTSFQMLYEVNLSSCLISILLLIAKNQLGQSIDFCRNHKVMVDITIFCLLSIAGQFLIYSVAFNFQLQQNMMPLVSTTRKIISIVVGLAVNGEHINLVMAISLVLVFGGMLYEVIDSTYYTITGTVPIRIWTCRVQEQHLSCGKERELSHNQKGSSTKGGSLDQRGGSITNYGDRFQFMS